MPEETKKSMPISTDPTCIVTDGEIELMLPLRTVSECNSTEHWHKKAVRHSTQKSLVKFALKDHCNKVILPCQLTLIRYAPRRLDKHDNLPMSMKWIVDAVCESITGIRRAGRADDDETKIAIFYCQVLNKEYGVKLLIRW